MRTCFTPLTLLSLAALSLGCTTPPEDTGADNEPAPSLDPWAKKLEGELYSLSVAAGPEGDLLLGGSFKGNVDFGRGTLTAQTYGSVFLAHLDAEGQALMSGSTGSDDAISRVAVGPDGGLYATGSVNGAMSFGSGKLNGTRDGFLTGFSADGEPRFTRQLNAEQPVYLWRVATTPQGNVVIAGQAEGSTDYGNGPGSVPTSTELAIAEYDSEGALVWVVRIPTYVISGLAMTTGKDGSVYFSGSTWSTIELAGSTVNYGTFVAKIGPDGTPAWLLGTQSNSGYPPTVTDMIVDDSGEVVLAGTYYYQSFSIGGAELPPSQQVNGFMLKLSPEGVGLSSRAFVTNNYSASTLALAAAPGGDVFCSMTLQGAADMGGGSLGSADYESHALIGRFGADLAHKKSAEISGKGSRFIWGLASDAKAQLVILGGYDWLVEIDGAQLAVARPDSIDTFLARMAF